MRTLPNLTDVSITRICRMSAGLLLLVLCCGRETQAQTPASHTTQPGTQNRNGTGCAGQEPNPSAANASDANCPELGPNFATPSMGVPGANRPPAVTSIIRVDATLPKPPVAMPAGDTFTVVGGATLVKTRRAALDACLSAGKRWSARSSAGTSTTCLDYKGQVIAYQECRASGGSPDCTVVMAEQESAKTP